MAKKKRKLSTYNLFVRKKVRAGLSFRQAAKAWKSGSNIGRILKPRRSAAKRKVSHMARRRTRRVYARARGGYRRYRAAGGGTLMRGLFPVPKLLSSALLGAGTAMIQQRVLPQIHPQQGIAAAFVVAGLPGAVGAFALGFLGNGQVPGGNGY